MRVDAMLPAASSVYVIQADGGPVKIGVTRNPQKRLASLRTGTPFPLSLAHVELLAPELRPGRVERTAHDLLLAARVHGEWFNVTAEEAVAAVRQAIADLQPDIRVALLPLREAHFLITGAQVRMARAGVRLSVRELAEAAKVAPNTVTRVEGEQTVNTSTLTLLQQALEGAGAEFQTDGSVRLKEPQA